MFETIRNKYKCIDKYFFKRDWNIITQNLIKQGITTLEKDLNEKEIIVTVREYYKDNSNYGDMKLKLIELENLKLFRSKFKFSNFHSLLITLVLGVIGWVISSPGNRISGEFILFVSYILLAMIAVGAYHDLFKDNKDTRLDVSINIHKNIIKEQLEKLKKNDENEKNLNEIKKTLEGTKRETETLRRVFETKKYT
jgi:hypothetical protein